MATNKRLLPCFFLLFVIGCVIAGCAFVDKTRCTVKSFDRDNCYERHGKLYLERYYNLNNTDHQGLVLCGVVINCDTSPCYNDVIVGNNYFCDKWNDHLNLMNVGLMDNFSPQSALVFIIGLLICLASITTFIMFIIHDKYTTGKKYSD